MSLKIGDVNPRNAPEPSQIASTNIGRIVTNEVITVQEAKEKYGWESIGNSQPNHFYWDLVIDAEDFVYKAKDTGETRPRRLFSGTRLQDKNGKLLDIKQRPQLIMNWFEEQGITVFPDPDDDNYDASEVVDRLFKFELVEPEQKGKDGKPLGRNIPKVIEVFDEDFKYTKDPYAYEVDSFDRNASGKSGALGATVATVKAVELTEDKEALAKFKDALDGVDLTDEMAVSTALTGVGLRSAKIGGKKIGGLLVNETFADKAKVLLAGD